MLRGCLFYPRFIGWPFSANTFNADGYGVTAGLAFYYNVYFPSVARESVSQKL
jgi:hypothetical protein